MSKKTLEDVPRPISNQPIPNHAKRVFQGKMFDVFQWDQEQYDGSIKQFEKITRPDTVVVVPVTSKGTILTTLQEQPGRTSFSALVGGRQELGETIFETARREMQEEIGYVCDSFKLWMAVHPTTKIDWVVYFLIGTDCRLNGQISNDAGEKIKLVEKSFDEFLQLAHDESFVEVEIVPTLLRALLSEEKMKELRSLILS